MELLQEITEASRTAVQAFVSDRTDAEGRVTSNALTNFARLAGLGQQPYLKALKARSTLAILLPRPLRSDKSRTTSLALKTMVAL